VQLQKQMIELAKQHKESKRACDALRLQIAQGAVPPCDRTGMRRLRESAVRLLKRGAGNIRAAPVAQFFQTAILSNMKVIELAFCCYAVTDMPRARTFYEGALGLKPTTVSDTPNGKWVEYEFGPYALAIGSRPA